MTLQARDYINLIPVPIDSDTYFMQINLSKGTRNVSKTFSFFIKKPHETSFKNNTDTDLNELLVIVPDSFGSNNEKIFSFYFLDRKINTLDFQYLWTVNNFNQESKYINGRNELRLKILNEDLLIGNNLINLTITDPKTNKIFTKTVNYEKSKPPYGGDCNVHPATGISMSTIFEFTIKEWINNSDILIYKIKYLNKNNIYIDISKGGFIETTWTSQMLPAASEFILEVTDSRGLRSIKSCPLKVLENDNFELLENRLQQEFDPSNRLLLAQIFKSNNRKYAEAEQPENIQINREINNKVLESVKYYLTYSEKESIQNDLENIISLVLNISSENFYFEKLEVLNQSIETIINNIEPLLQYTDKLQNIYNILDNMFNKVSQTEETQNKRKLLESLHNFLQELSGKILNNLISGQVILIQNENYNIQTNKVSQLNLVDLTIQYDSNFENLFNNKNKYSLKKKVRIRKLQNKSFTSCDSLVAICVPKNNLMNIMKQTDSKVIGFKGQLNHKPILPITEPQFSNSLDFSLNVEDINNNILRRLDISELLSIYFEIRLKFPPQSGNTTKIIDAACVQYENKNPEVSCDSWYDMNANEVVCYCNQQGLTVNVLDKSLSNMSKLKQFPSISADICKFLNYFYLKFLIFN